MFIVWVGGDVGRAGALFHHLPQLRHTIQLVSGEGGKGGEIENQSDSLVIRLESAI